jgi:hypothetical protein
LSLFVVFKSATSSTLAGKADLSSAESKAAAATELKTAVTNFAGILCLLLIAPATIRHSHGCAVYEANKIACSARHPLKLFGFSRLSRRKLSRNTLRSQYRQLMSH